jgi:hypothetical protein
MSLKMQLQLEENSCGLVLCAQPLFFKPDDIVYATGECARMCRTRGILPSRPIIDL